MNIPNYIEIFYRIFAERLRRRLFIEIEQDIKSSSKILRLFYRSEFGSVYKRIIFSIKDSDFIFVPNVMKYLENSSELMIKAWSEDMEKLEDLKSSFWKRLKFLFKPNG